MVTRTARRFISLPLSADILRAFRDRGPAATRGYSLGGEARAAIMRGYRLKVSSAVCRGVTGFFTGFGFHSISAMSSSRRGENRCGDRSESFNQINGHHVPVRRDSAMFADILYRSVKSKTPF